MTTKRKFCCAQLFGALLFCVGLVAGILIVIYAYHGGRDAEVTCKVHCISAFSYEKKMVI
jgi:hypothetical protein